MKKVIDPILAKLGANIKAARHKAEMSQTDVAKALGCAKQTVSVWELGYGAPEYLTLVRFAKLVGVDPAVLQEGTVELVPADDVVLERTQRSSRVVLVYDMRTGVEIMAGLLSEDTTSRLQVIGVNVDVSRRARALKVVGNANVPRYFPGDIVIIDPEVIPQPREWVVAKVNGEPVLRRFIPAEAGTSLGALLEAEDKSWPALRVGADDIIVGTLVQSVSTRRD